MSWNGFNSSITEFLNPGPGSGKIESMPIAVKLFHAKFIHLTLQLDLIKMHFVNHPGFAYALGVWWENVEKQQEKNSEEKHGEKLVTNQ